MGGDNDYNVLPGTNYLFGNTILNGLQVGKGRVYVANNVILPGVAYPLNNISIYTPNPPQLSNDYNLSTISFVNDSGTTQGPHDIVTNYVGFVNSTNALYWLAANSPARGKALAGVCGPVDFFGKPQSSAGDIGAFQYNATLAGDIRVLDPSPSNPGYWSLA